MPGNTNKERLVSISEIEQAINYWRQLHPSSRDTMTLCPQASALAELYARMIVFQMGHMAWSEFPAITKKSFKEAETVSKPGQNKAA